MSEKFREYLKIKEDEWESLCLRCGACCGAYDDPCTHLKKDGDGLYYCDIYEHRFGPRVTKGGEEFKCVHIRQLLNRWWPNSHKCPYKKMFFSGW